MSTFLHTLTLIVGHEILQVSRIYQNTIYAHSNNKL